MKVTGGRGRRKSVFSNVGHSFKGQGGNVPPQRRCRGARGRPGGICKIQGKVTPEVTGGSDQWKAGADGDLRAFRGNRSRLGGKVLKTR